MQLCSLTTQANVSSGTPDRVTCERHSELLSKSTAIYSKALVTNLRPLRGGYALRLVDGPAYAQRAAVAARQVMLGLLLGLVWTGSRALQACSRRMSAMQSSHSTQGTY